MVTGFGGTSYFNARYELREWNTCSSGRRTNEAIVVGAGTNGMVKFNDRKTIALRTHHFANKSFAHIFIIGIFLRILRLVYALNMRELVD